MTEEFQLIFLLKIKICDEFQIQIINSIEMQWHFADILNNGIKMISTLIFFSFRKCLFQFLFFSLDSMYVYGCNFFLFFQKELFYRNNETMFISYE